MRSKLFPVNPNASLPPLNSNLIIPPPPPSTQTLPNSPRSKISSISAIPDTLMNIANKTTVVEYSDPIVSNPAITIDSSKSKVHSSPTTATFHDYQGVIANQDIEKTLLDAGFIPTEKILTKDDNSNLICHFIKVRDHVGRASYVELDCDDKDGMGYIKISPTDTILTESHEASIIPYSLTIGSFEANKGDIYGVGFECDNSICVMSRKDPSLEPVQTVFHYTKDSGDDMGIIENHYVPFPIVKMTEILANPKAVHHGIASSHLRMRDVAFSSCNKEVIGMKKYVSELQNEIHRFEEISSRVNSILSSSINELERWHEHFTTYGTKSPQDAENLKAVRFNLAKRHDLTLDYIALCHSMKERSIKISILRDEIKAFNDFSETLFRGVDSVLVE